VKQYFPDGVADWCTAWLAHGDAGNMSSSQTIR